MDLPTLPVGERVRHHRTRRGRTQAVVAGLCGITEDYLSQIERGLKKPSHDVLTKLADHLQVPIAALLGDTETDTADVPSTHAAPTSSARCSASAPSRRHSRSPPPVSGSGWKGSGGSGRPRPRASPKPRPSCPG